MRKQQLILSIIAFILFGTIIIGIYKQHHGNTTARRSLPKLETNIISGTFDTSKLKSEQEWKKILSPQQFTIMRQAGTEIPFTGSLLHNSKKGVYTSPGCDIPLFSSDKKFDSGTGWPSFWAPIDSKNIVLKEDTSIPGASRIEVLDRCGNHLGHVFDDGPAPTGKRYCMNSAALKFIPDKVE